MPDFIDNEHLRNLLRTAPGDAIEILYDLYSAGLRSIARKFTRDESAADDIVQETFVHIWKNAYRLGEMHEKSIQHYLVRVVRNLAITHYKDSIRGEALKNSFAITQAESREDPFEVILILNENNQELRRLISTFPERERECLFLKLDGQMKNEQIARQLEITEKAVERCITSAYKRIRKHFQREKNL